MGADDNTVCTILCRYHLWVFVTRIYSRNTSHCRWLWVGLNYSYIIPHVYVPVGIFNYRYYKMLKTKQQESVPEEHSLAHISFPMNSLHVICVPAVQKEGRNDVNAPT